jgi:hypothetical protein
MGVQQRILKIKKSLSSDESWGRQTFFLKKTFQVPDLGH